MKKTYINENVYEAAQKRIQYLFDNFEKILIAFSGGKDSGVCLNMCYDYAKETGQLNKLAMFHLDYEAQYQMTTDYVTETFLDDFPEIQKYWLCLPMAAQCACSMTSGTWTPWDADKHDIWVREMPENEYVINEYNVPFDFKKNTTDYDLQEAVGKWYGSEHGKTAVVIGIRTDESLNRFRAIASDSKVNAYDGTNWMVQKDPVTINAYSIYDWTVEDIWTYYAKFEKKYNKLYDLFYQAGLTIHQMRVASPFNDCAMGTLRLYKVIDPNNWGKMISRVNGVNMAGLYGGTTAMGWKNITKPDHLTWQEYANFLLNTLPDDVRENYLKKLETSIKFWRDTGGNLDEETIAELKAENANAIYTGHGSKRSDKEVVKFPEYPDDTTVTNFKAIPTYKRLCICIMKNDYYCKYMGFSQTKKETEKRKSALEKYKNL